MGPIRFVATATVASISLLAATACASGDAETLTAGVPRSSSTELEPLGTPQLTATSTSQAEPARLTVANIRVGSHASFDRIVFDLDGDGTPGWYVDETSTPTQQGSGKPISFDGVTALNVNIDGIESIADLPHIDGVGIISSVVPAGVSDSRAQFIIGLSAAAPFSVSVLEDPQRLVIDIVGE